jgi:hypothetical protein
MTWRYSKQRARKAPTDRSDRGFASSRPDREPAPAALAPQVAAGAFSPSPPRNEMFPYAPPRDHAPWIAVAFHKEHGPYPRYSERHIRNFEHARAIAQPRPPVVNVTREFFGDPIATRSIA